MWFEAGQDVTLLIDYLVDGIAVPPDSAAFTLRSPTGTVLLSGTLPALLNSEPVVIPAVHNALPPGDVFSSRFLTVSYLHEGATYSIQKSYRLHPFVPLTGTADQVRSELGLDPSELVDREVDLLQAYVHLAADYGTTFVAALSAAGVTNLAANQAVVVRAALQIADSLALRVGLTTRSEDHLLTRFSGLDFEALRTRLETKLRTLMVKATGEVVSLTTGSSIFLLSSPTDAVTGA